MYIPSRRRASVRQVNSVECIDYLGDSPWAASAASISFMIHLVPILLSFSASWYSLSFFPKRKQPENNNLPRLKNPSCSFQEFRPMFYRSLMSTTRGLPTILLLFILIRDMSFFPYFFLFLSHQLLTTEKELTVIDYIDQVDPWWEKRIITR